MWWNCKNFKFIHVFEKKNCLQSVLKDQNYASYAQETQVNDEDMKHDNKKELQLIFLEILGVIFVEIVI